MSTSIEWRAPQAVVKQEENALRAMGALMWRTVKRTLLMLCLPAAVLGYVAVSQELAAGASLHWLISLALPKLLGGALIVLMFAVVFFLDLRSKKAIRYEVSEKGLRCHSPTQGWSVAWKRVDGYCFRDHDDEPGLRVIECSLKPIRFLKATGQDYRLQLPFDPHEVEEKQVQAVLQQHAGFK